MGLLSPRPYIEGELKDFKLVDEKQYKKTLYCLDVVNNHNKYYTMELHTDGTNYKIYSEYGRKEDGRASKKEIRETSNSTLALRAWNELYKDKLKKYKEMDLVQSGTGTEKAKELIDVTQIKVDPKKNNAKIKKSSLEPAIQEFVRQIYDEANKKIASFVKGSTNSSNEFPLGKLSQRQIEEGRIVLQEIINIVSTKKKVKPEDVVELSQEFFTLIPRHFSGKITPELIAINTHEKISDQIEMLKLYEDALKLGDVMFDGSSIDNQYAALNSTITVLDPNSDKYKWIVDYVKSSQSHHHKVNLHVRRIFTVKQKNAPEFDDHYGNVQTLFHGSRSANLPGILSTNLKLPSKLKNVVITGAMFGPGLYFANCSTKSSQYSCSRFGGTINKYKTAFMFLCDVSLGKIKEEYRSIYYREAPKGYDSVKGCKGQYLLHDEFIVYRENQQRITHIIEFEAKSK